MTSEIDSRLASLAERFRAISAENMRLSKEQEKKVKNGTELAAMACALSYGIAANLAIDLANACLEEVIGT